MDISFSARFENILKITESFLEKGRDPADARDQAQFLEGEILKNATSANEYQQLCSELIVEDEDEADALMSFSEPEETDEIFNTEGPVVGHYEHGTFHKDGQMSTILKARAVDPAANTKIVALKITTPSQMQPPHNSQREARLLVQAKHEHVVELLESFWFEGDRLVLVFPFLRQDLENLLRSGALTGQQVHMVLHGLFSALTHIHSLGIIHRDVKPSNVLLKSMNGPVFLADFGIAWSPTDPQSEAIDCKITDVGTTCYRPPELLFGNKSYDTSLDMWAAGCLVAEMARQSHNQLFDPGPLGSELGLIKSIFTTLGTPNENTWPIPEQSVVHLPDWGKMRFQDFPAKPWDVILENTTDDLISLVQQTVCYESTKRLTASQAVEHRAVTNEHG